MAKKQTLWVMLNEREIHMVYECTKYNGYTEVEDCTLPKPYNPLRYIVKNSQIVDDPRKLKDEIARLTAENAELRARLSKAVELPAIVMIERTLVNGKFKPTQKAQAFNGRIGVVYRDETKWKGLLVDICSEKTSDYEPAKACLAELKGGGRE